MHVQVTLHATLRKYAPARSGDAVAIEMPDGGTVADVIARLAIPQKHAWMLVSGNESLELTSVLRDGQELHLFPPLAGGA